MESSMIGGHNYLASSYEDSTTSSAQMREKTEETTLPSPAQPGVAVTFPGFLTQISLQL